MKSIEFIGITSVFEGLVGCVHEWKRYRKSIHKSTTNQCKNDGRPNDPKNAENHEKWTRKGDQDHGRIHQKGVTEKDTKNDDNQIYLPTPPQRA